MTNATPGQTMNIQNVTITGPAAGFSLCTNSNVVLYGIFFNGAGGGSVTNVTVDHIFQFQNGAFGSCQTGRAIRADNSGTVTITNTTVRDYQKSGFEARGPTIMNVSGSTAGPSHPLGGIDRAERRVDCGGRRARWRTTRSIGSGDAQPGVGGNGAGTAVLLSGAHDVTVTNNTLTSPAPRRASGPTSAYRSAPGAPLASSSVSTGSIGLRPRRSRHLRSRDRCLHPGWLECDVDLQHLQPVDYQRRRRGTDLMHPAAQRHRVPGLLGPRSGCRQRQELRAEPFPIIDATPFTWTVDSGTLPPGLSLSSGGAITGTPTAAGTYNFTMKVVDSTGLTATQAQTITIASGGVPHPHPRRCSTRRSRSKRARARRPSRSAARRPSTSR